MVKYLFKKRRQFVTCLLVLVHGVSCREANLRGHEQANVFDKEDGGDSDHYMRAKADSSTITAQTAEGRDYLYGMFIQTLHLPEHKLPPGISEPEPPTETTPGSVPDPTTTMTATSTATVDAPLTYEPGVFTNGARSSDGMIIHRMDSPHDPLLMLVSVFL